MELKYNMATHDYHIRQYETMYETTRGILELMDHHIPDMGSRSLVDVASGGGANVVHMLRRWPGITCKGFDLCTEDLNFSKTQIPEDLVDRISYEEGDLFQFKQTLPENTFDCMTMMQTMLLFDPNQVRETLQNLIHITKEWIFMSGLFTEHNVDVVMKMRDNTTGLDTCYNIHDIAVFRKTCDELGIKEVFFTDFNIAIDLPKPEGGGIGTWTQKMENGERLQFSGAVPMPWKFCALKLA